MDFKEYQKEALKTAKYHNLKIPAIAYCGLKLSGEAGEVSEKIGKVFRDKGGDFDHSTELELAKELGDVLWYCAAVADLLGMELEWCAELNIKKLTDREARGVIHGSGDNR